MTSTGFRLTDFTLKVNDVDISELGEGYSCTYFHVQKKLLEPNQFVFHLQNDVDRNIFSKTGDDISFALRNDLLGKKVHASIASTYVNEEGDDVADENPDFFIGYITNVKLQHVGNTAARIICTAQSPDCLLKDHPGCEEYDYFPVEEVVKYRLDMFKDAEGNPMFEYIVNSRYESSDSPQYLVRYNESTYDFIKRLAIRYGEFFYSEEGKIIFGEMPEQDSVRLHMDAGLDSYCYDLQVAQHKGTMLCDLQVDKGWTSALSGGETDDHNDQHAETPSLHEMIDSTYDISAEMFGKGNLVINDLESSTEIEESSQENMRSSQLATKVNHNCLKSGMMICNGEAKSGILKLGTPIVIVDATSEGEDVEHEPLRIIELEYEWGSQNERKTRLNADVCHCYFKAMTGNKEAYPPYPSRKEDGFPDYDMMNRFPMSQPQLGVVTNNVDPQGLGRVRVRLLWQSRIVYHDAGDMRSDWETPYIHVLQPYVGKNSTGCYFIPEVDDLVMVGFYHGNAEMPFVMGCVRNAERQKAPESWVETRGEYQGTDDDGNDSYADGNNKDNEVKAIRTRNGHTVEIHDTEKGGFIKIYDNNTKSYSFLLSTDEHKITLQSEGNIELKAGRNIWLDANNRIVLGSGNLTYFGSNGDIKADAGGDIDMRASGVLYECGSDEAMVVCGDKLPDGEMEGGGINTMMHLTRDYFRMRKGNDQDSSFVVGMNNDGDAVGILAKLGRIGISTKDKIAVEADGDIALHTKQNFEIKSEMRGTIDCKMALDASSKATKIQ